MESHKLEEKTEQVQIASGPSDDGAIRNDEIRAGATLHLVTALCKALDAEGINYCHWKSNPFLHRSASGDNDLDLLIDRRDGEAFTKVLSDLGFKATLSPSFEALPGVRSYYGCDTDTGRLIHVHAHYQLVLGNDLSKNYRLPVEKQYLASVHQEGMFRLPAPEFELVIFVIRMVLKHSTWDSILMGHGRLSPSEAEERKCLTRPAVLARAHIALRELRIIDTALFELCLQAIQPSCPLGTRVSAGEQLQKALASYARRPQAADICLKLWRRVWRPILARVFHYSPKKQLAHGGLFVAIVGGDGSGKTTLLDELSAWLSDTFEVTRLHMGKPKWSAPTKLIRGLLKIGTILHLYSFEGDVYEESTQSHGYPWFLRAACTAHDRYLIFSQARREAANGRLVLCDRFSLPGFLATDGPRCQEALANKKVNRFLAFLTRLEAEYYSGIGLPDLLIVLKVDPEIAVQRKAEETEASVRARSTEVFSKDWAGLPAHILDASQPKSEILAQARALLWESL